MNLLYKTFAITWDCCKITITINQFWKKECVKQEIYSKFIVPIQLLGNGTKRGMNILVLKDIFSHIIAESCKQMLAIF